MFERHQKQQDVSGGSNASLIGARHSVQDQMGAEGAQAGVTYAPPVEASGSGGASLVTQVRTRLAKISAEPATVFGVWVLMALVFGFINSKFWTSANFLAIGEAAARHR